MCFFGLGFGIAEISSVFRPVHAFVHRRAILGILGLLYFAVSLRYRVSQFPGFCIFLSS